MNQNEYKLNYELIKNDRKCWFLKIKCQVKRRQGEKEIWIKRYWIKVNRSKKIVNKTHKINSLQKP